MTKTTHTTIGEANPGETLTVDHYLQTFTVTIRTLGSVHPLQLSDLIQTKWEVMALKEEAKHVVSVGPRIRDTFPE
jgi:hypothetical protein